MEKQKKKEKQKRIRGRISADALLSSLFSILKRYKPVELVRKAIAIPISNAL
jgi:hypothetical protein